MPNSLRCAPPLLWSDGGVSVLSLFSLKDKGEMDALIHVGVTAMLLF